MLKAWTFFRQSVFADRLSGFQALVFFQAPEYFNYNYSRSKSQYEFCKGLSIGQTVHWEQSVENKEGRYLQHDLAHDGKNQRFFPHAAGLVHTHAQKVYGHEGQSQAQSPKEGGTQVYHIGIFYEQSHQSPAENKA